MGSRGRALAIGVLVVSVAVAGCGGNETSGQVTVDHSKDEDLMKAMQGYMEKRSGPKAASKAGAKAKSAH